MIASELPVHTEFVFVCPLVFELGACTEAYETHTHGQTDRQTDKRERLLLRPIRTAAQ